MKICQPWIYICTIETEQWNEMNSPLSHKWNMAVCGERGGACCKVEIWTRKTHRELRSSGRAEGSVWLKCEEIPSKIHLNPPHLKEKTMSHSTAGCLRNTWASVVLEAIWKTRGEYLICRNGNTQEAASEYRVLRPQRPACPAHLLHRCESWGPRKEDTCLRNHSEPVKFFIHSSLTQTGLFPPHGAQAP